MALLDHCLAMEEGLCRTTSHKSSALICASGIWQNMPLGQWYCLEGHLVLKPFWLILETSVPAAVHYPTRLSLPTVCSVPTEQPSTKIAYVPTSGKTSRTSKNRQTPSSDQYKAYRGDGSAAPTAPLWSRDGVSS